MARRLVHIFKFLLNKTLVFVQFVSHLSAAVQRMEVKTVAGLAEFTAALSRLHLFPFIHSFSTLGDFQFNFFLFVLLFNSSCSRLSSSRSSCTAIFRLKYKQTQKIERCSSADKRDAAFRPDDSFYLLASSFCISFQLLSMNLSA